MRTKPTGIIIGVPDRTSFQRVVPMHVFVPPPQDKFQSNGGGGGRRERTKIGFPMGRVSGRED